MKTDTKRYYLFSILIILLFFITLISLGSYGRRSRAGGQGHLLNDPKLIKVSVGRPEEAYKLWKQKGFKGRIVVALSRRLNFVLTDAGSLIPRMSFPLKVFSLSKAIEGDLKAENFLLVSMETGVAREIIHTIPEKVFSEKLEYAGKEEGVSIAEGRIEIPYAGSPRVITSMPFLKPPDEPVLIYINASIFKDYEPEELMRQLLKVGIKTDYVVLCRSYDDSEVTEREREKLKVFETIIGTSGAVGDSKH